MSRRGPDAVPAVEGSALVEAREHEEPPPARSAPCSEAGFTALGYAVVVAAGYALAGYAVVPAAG